MVMIHSEGLVQVFPNIKGSKETYDAHLTREVWIESTDFREVDAPGYYGLAPQKLVALRSASFTPIYVAH